MSFDHRELDALAVDLGKLSAPTHRAVRGVFAEGATDLVSQWRANATETAGEHGRLYPRSISSEEKFSTSILFEVGPDPSKPQGGMSFEFGSVNQPPHLDGQRAADEVVPRLARRVALAAEDVFRDA